MLSVDVPNVSVASQPSWRSQLERRVINYNAYMSASKKGQQWELAVGLLKEMCLSRLEPIMLSYNAGISAREKGKE